MTVAGSFNSELGCSEDWSPPCAAVHLTARADEFVASVLEAYRRHLASATDEEMDAWVHKTRQGNPISIEMLLEHAVVHPMRHRVQLERILSES